MTKNKPAVSAPEPAQFISRREAAALLTVNVQSIDKLIRSGVLPAYQLGRRILIKKDQLLRMVEAHEIQ